jgi:hypothetical protein
MSLNVKIKIDDNITPSCQKKLKQLDAVPYDVYNFWKAHTPIAKINGGNARRNTFLKKDEIIAAYPYAQRLDDGLSPQAPDGMSKPTEAYFKRRIDAILGKK